MLHIILLILKIIGMILLGILGILLLALLCALFVPVRYRIEVTRTQDEGSPPFEARIKVTWLLHFVNILIRYPAEVVLRVRIMLFTLFRFPEKDRAEGQRRTGAREKKKRKDTVRTDDAKTEKRRVESASAQHNTDKTEKEAVKSPDVAEGKRKPELPAKPAAPAKKDEWNRWDTDVSCQFEETLNEDTQSVVPAGTEDAGGTAYREAGSEQEESSEQPKASLLGKIKVLFDKIRQIIAKIKSQFENIQYTIRKLCDKIKSTLDNIQYYRQVLESDAFKHSFGLCREQIGYIIRKLKPDRFEADFVVGTGDPASTGEVLAIWGMLYPLIGQHVRIVGDFACDGLRVEGRLYIKGKIRAFTFLRVAIRIYFNKDIRKLIRLLKKEAA